MAKPSIIPFRPAARAVLPPTPLPLPPSVALAGCTVPTEVPRQVGIDLSGKRKAWFMLGRGRIGKTTLTRWVAETTELRGGSAIFAAADPVNRSLRAFLSGVAEPPTSNPEDVKDWLRDLLGAAMEGQANAVIDLGGGNTSLSFLLAEIPDLTAILTAGGIEPVAVHVVGSDPHDLVPLAIAEAEGFQPAATAIILNEAHGRRQRFDQVLAHPTLRAAVDRGAIVLWMPLLTPDAARQCDASAWHYHDVVTKGGLTKAGPFTVSSVQTWLRRMGEELQPIASWMPE